MQYAQGKAKTSLSSLRGADYANGQIVTDSYGVGATLTWYSVDGFYVDAQAQANWYSSDLALNGGPNLITGTDAFGYAASVELGQVINLDQNWSLKPQVQLTYSNVKFDQFTDTYGAMVQADRTNNLEGRAGVSLDYRDTWVDANGDKSALHFYSVVNIYHGFSDDTSVNVGGTALKSRSAKTKVGAGVGASYKWKNDKYSLYGELNVKADPSDLNNDLDVKAMVGFRMKF